MSEDGLSQLRRLLDDAFEGSFSDDDWSHILGGRHVVARGDAILGHAAVIERTLQVGQQTYRAGYVEGVVTTPSRQGEGIGTIAMRRVDQVLRDEFELGALSTGRHGFYERLGWRRWQGPTFARDGERLIRTTHEDSNIMVLPLGPSVEVMLTELIICESRPGDDW